MSIKISIITICRNAGKELERTINSVMEQTYPDIEYVFIDGNSDDEDTLVIINNKKAHIDLFYSEKDSGIYDAMNKGIKAATGDLLLFINAGDRLADPNSIEAAVNLIGKKRAMLYFSDVVWVDVDKKVVRAGLPEIKFASDLYSKNFPHSGTFYKRECFAEYGVFDNSYKILGDYELNLRLLLKHNLPFTTVDTLVSVFYTGGISTSSGGKEKREKEMEQIKLKYFPDLIQKDAKKKGNIFGRITNKDKNDRKLNRV